MIHRHLRSGLSIRYILLLSMLMSACGGGGSGNSIPSSNNSQVAITSSKASTSTMSSSSASAPTFAGEVTRQNTAELLASYLDLLEFAKETSAAIVKGEYSVNLADGYYEDACDGKGKLQVTVSNNGKKIIQKYLDCQLSITDSTGIHLVSITGEEQITIDRKERMPSKFTLYWKEYSVTESDNSTLVLDGQFNYEGLLYFDRNIIYENIHSDIFIDARIDDGTQKMEARNVNFRFDFPAILNKYGNDAPHNLLEPKRLHVFQNKVLRASGEITLAQSAAKFAMDATSKTLTFSGLTQAKTRIDATPNGFLLRWDENSDAISDATVFLTETEYSVLFSNINSSTNPIYYTIYKDNYGSTYPKKHFIKGYYEAVHLSKGATAEIDVQELFTNVSGALLTYEINGESYSKDWEQIEAGKFLLKFPDSVGNEIFELSVTATDIHGNRSPAIVARIRMNDNLSDIDKDGTPDYLDADMDNDGFPNYEDRFPKDPNEHADTDRDSIGDNTDPDIDNDGIANASDSHPQDASCNKLTEGDNAGCFMTQALYSFTDKFQVAHFTQTRYENNAHSMRFIRFDMNARKFLPATDFIPYGFVDGNSYNAESHSVLTRIEHENSLYIIQLDDNSLKLLRKDEDDSSHIRFSEFGYFIVSASMDNSNLYWLEVYDANGIMTDSSKTSALKNIREEIPFNLQRSAAVPFCEYSVSVNAQGKLVETGDYTKRHGDNCIGQIELSANKQLGFSSSGLSTPIGIFNNQRQKLIDIQYINPQWLQNNIMYHIWNTNELVIVNPVNQVSRHFPNTDNKSRFIVGNQIITIENTNSPFASYLQIHDENLQLMYSSKK